MKQKYFLIMLLLCGLLSNAQYYWQASSINSLTGGDSYLVGDVANNLVLNVNQCPGGIKKPHYSTNYKLTWYKNAVNSNVGGEEVSSVVVTSPHSYSASFTYTPSTSVKSIFYYYAVLSNPTVTNCGFTDTLVSETQKVEVGEQATHLNFDGVDDYIDIGNIVPEGSSYTKEVWVKANNASQFNIISSARCVFWCENGIVKASNGNLSDVHTDLSSFFGEWTHIAVTYDSATTTMKLYINGILKAENTSVAQYLADPIQIGAFLSGTVFNGSMDEVRIWNIARTAEQINETMDNELQGDETGLLAYYQFNQGFAAADNTTVTSLDDATGNGNNGTLNNFTLNGETSNWLGGSTFKSFTLAFNNFNAKFQAPLIHPNPSTGMFNITTQENVSVIVYDLLGKAILKQSVGVEQGTIDISNYASGVYVLKATNVQGKVNTIKLVKQ